MITAIILSVFMQAMVVLDSLDNAVTWTPGTGPIAGYELERSDDGGVTWNMIVDTQLPTAVVTSQDGDSYVLRVKSYGFFNGARYYSPYSIVSDPAQVVLSGGPPPIGAPGKPIHDGGTIVITGGTNTINIGTGGQ